MLENKKYDVLFTTLIVVSAILIFFISEFDFLFKIFLFFCSIPLSLFLLYFIFTFFEKLSAFFNKNTYSKQDESVKKKSIPPILKFQEKFPKYRSYSYNLNTHFLYHFTDPRNIPSIKKYGLLSWYELNKKNIYHIPASNSLSRNLDIRRNLQDYVRLSLNKNHPMFARAINEGRVKNLVWLKIDPIVMNFPDTLFSNDNATSNRAVINNNKDTALKSKSSQAEVLVKKRIDPKYIIFPSGF